MSKRSVITKGKWELENLPDAGPAIRYHDGSAIYLVWYIDGVLTFHDYLDGRGWVPVRALTTCEAAEWAEMNEIAKTMPLIMEEDDAERNVTEDDLLRAAEDGLMPGAAPADDL